MKLKEKILDWLLGDSRHTTLSTSQKEELKDFLYDFFQNYNGTITINGTTNGQSDDRIVVSQVAAEGVEQPTPEQPKHENVRPKDVYDELERVPIQIDIDTESINKKIDLLKRKIGLGDFSFYTDKQINGMIKRLEYRRDFYNAYKDFFEQFAYTTQDKIDDLLQKYPSLTMKKSTLFIPTFPEDAIEKMEEYSIKVKEITGGEKTVFYVIAKKDDFKEKERRLDPILLVQSPFGFFWQILGAWDEEMLLLEEL